MVRAADSLLHHFICAAEGWKSVPLILSNNPGFKKSLDTFADLSLNCFQLLAELSFSLVSFNTERCLMMSGIKVWVSVKINAVKPEKKSVFIGHILLPGAYITHNATRTDFVCWCLSQRTAESQRSVLDRVCGGGHVITSSWNSAHFFFGQNDSQLSHRYFPSPCLWTWKPVWDWSSIFFSVVHSVSSRSVLLFLFTSLSCLFFFFSLAVLSFHFTFLFLFF